MNLDLGKLAFNALASRRLDGSADGNSQTIGNANDDVADRSLQPRIGERNTSARQRGNNQPASRLGVNTAGHRTNLDTAATRLEFCQSQDIIEFDAPAATLGSDLAFAFVHLDSAAPRFQDHDSPTFDIDLSPTGLGRH